MNKTMDKTRWAIIALTALLSVAMLLVLATGVGADASLGVTPAKLEMSVPKDGSRSSHITVLNRGDTPVDVTAYVMDYSIDKQNSFTFSEPGHESYSCAKWVTLEPAEFHLEANSTKEVKVTIAVPPEVEPGGKYCVALFETTLPSENGATGVTPVLRVGTLILLTIPGVSDASIVTEAELAEVGLYQGSPMHASMVVRNTGNVHLNVAGQVDFYGTWGAHSDTMSLGEITTLPNTERELSAVWENEPSFGKVKAVFTLGYIDKNGELINISGEATQWFFSVTWIIIGVASLLVLVALGWVAKRKLTIKVHVNGNGKKH